MNSLHRLLVLLLAGAWITTGFAAASTSEAGVEKRIAEVLSKQESYFRLKILLPHELAVKEMTAKYVAAVKAEQENVRAAGNLEGVIEARDELKRIENGEPLPRGGGRAFSKVPELREVYRGQLKALNDAQGERKVKFAEIVDGKLSELESEYTKAKDIPAAKKVREFRDRLKALGLPFVVGEDEGVQMAGRLRAFSNVRGPYEKLDISKAESYDDFVLAVNLRENGWAALRKNGAVVSSDNAFDGKEGVAALTSKAILYKDGRIEIVRDHGRGIVVAQGGREVISTSGVTVAIIDEGRVKTWGRVVRREDYTLPPVDLTGAIAVSATHGSQNARSYAVRADGSVVTWGEKSFKSVLPESIPGLVQLDAGWLHFVALTKDGRVQAWPPGPPWTRIPGDLPRIIKINAQCNITAVQKEDLSWQAWGDGAMGVRDKINQIGPAIEIAYEANGRGWGHLLWIEPLE